MRVEPGTFQTNPQPNLKPAFGTPDLFPKTEVAWTVGAEVGVDPGLGLGLGLKLWGKVFGVENPGGVKRF